MNVTEERVRNAVWTAATETLRLERIAEIRREERKVRKMIGRLYNTTTPLREIEQLSHDLDIAVANELTKIPYHCPGCGKQLFDDAAYCTPCGEEANALYELDHRFDKEDAPT